MNLKWKAVISIMLIILLFWVGLVGFIYKQGLDDLNQVVANRVASARDVATTVEKALYPRFQKRILSLINVEVSDNRRNMIKAFHQRDRETLLKLSTPLYKLLKNESDELRSFAWILPDNTAFLRLHYPELKNDDVSQMRPDIAAANRKHRQVAGYSTSGMGLGYHISQPVFWQGEFSGVVQFGIDIAPLVSLLKDRLDAPTGIMIPQDKAQFIKQQHKQLPSLDIGDYVILSADPTDFSINTPELNWQEERSWFKEKDKHYALVRLLPLLDFNNKPVGYIVGKLDMSKDYFASMARFWTVFGTSSLLLLVLFVLLFTNFNHLLKEIFQLNKSLEKQNSTLEKRVSERSAELQRSKDNWVAMFNSIPDMVTIQDHDLKIIEANRAVCDFFQLEPEDIVGKHCYELFYERKSRCDDCKITEILQHQTAYKSTIYNDVLEKTFHITAAPIYNENGQVKSFVHITQDMTRQKQLEEDLIQAQKMEAIGTLAGGIAHDFNNILSAIIGYATMAHMREEEGSRLSRDLDSIIKAGNRAADLVKQILTFSRKDATCEELFQPHLLLKEVLKMLRSSIPSSIEIVTNVDPNSGWIQASQVRLHQVIMNLCTNAVQAMPGEKGTLTINLQPRVLKKEEISEPGIEAGEFICLSVADTGCGMDSRTIERIFDPYFTTKTGEQGTGLGLAVVHGIVRELNGFIRVFSEPGQGSRFEIYLPPSTLTEQVPLEQAPLALESGAGNLLVVDDEIAIIEIMGEMLRELGYQVDTELNSQKALEKIRQQPSRYDLVITDQTMPEVTGLELAEELYRLNPVVPVIICTGYSSIIKEQNSLSQNIKKLMAKPLPLAELASTVQLILKKGA